MKKRKTLVYIAIIIVILVISIAITGLMLIRMNKQDSQKLDHSQSEIKAEDPNLLGSGNEETFEIIGYGELEINKEYPNINLINSSENKVYLSFDVLYGDEVLYKSNLISPGQMEQYDVYRKLDAGQYTLTYSINVYDINENILWSGIQQEQKISIKN